MTIPQAIVFAALSFTLCALWFTAALFDSGALGFIAMIATIAWITQLD